MTFLYTFDQRGQENIFLEEKKVFVSSFLKCITKSKCQQQNFLFFGVIQYIQQIEHLEKNHLSSDSSTADFDRQQDQKAELSHTTLILLCIQLKLKSPSKDESFCEKGIKSSFEIILLYKPDIVNETIYRLDSRTLTTLQFRYI